MKEDKQKYYGDNKENILEKALRHDEQHREEKREYAKNYRLEHPEKIRISQKHYEIVHVIERRLYAQWYRANYKEENSLYQKGYRIEHRGSRQVHEESRRARKRGAPINDFTHEQWVALQEAYKHRCAYCNKRRKGKLTQDHITPLSKGGSHTLANIVPACQPCNSKKRTGAPLKPVQPLLLTVAQKNTKRKRS